MDHSQTSMIFLPNATQAGPSSASPKRLVLPKVALDSEAASDQPHAPFNRMISRDNLNALWPVKWTEPGSEAIQG